MRPSRILVAVLVVCVLAPGDSGADKSIARATTYVDGLGDEDRGIWRERIKTGLMRRKFTEVLGAGDAEALSTLVRAHKEELEQCVVPWLFYAAARALAENGMEKEAVPVLRGLLQACPDDRDLRLGVLYGLRPLLPFSEIRPLLKEEKNRLGLPAPYARDVTALELHILKERLAATPLISQEAGALAGEVLALDPGDKSALTALAWWHYHNGRYEEAGGSIKRVLDSDPEDSSARMLLAWTLYNSGSLGEARPVFEVLYEEQNDPRAAEGLLSVHEKTGDRSEGFVFASSVAGTDDKGLNKAAADYFFRQRCPILAAETYNGLETCYYNAHTPRLELEAYYRYKSGDMGLSRLVDISFPVSFSYPFRRGNELTLTVIPERLNAGSAPSAPFAGSFYRGVQVIDLETSFRVFTPHLTLKREGATIYTLGLGMTPAGGPVSPRETFLLRAERGKWDINLHRSPVKESILSYVGLKDPYGDGKWGRVTKTGVEVEYTAAPFPSCWLTLKAGYDDYRGRKVVDNKSYQGTVSFGKTYDTERGEVSTGVFASAMRFERNSNFFTFGHGGYFTPGRFFNAGPTFRFRTRPCRDSWIDIQTALSYLNFRTEDAPYYPLDGNIGGEYKGDSHSGIGMALELEGLKLLTPHWAAGASLKLNRSADYTEWTAGLTLRYFFGPRTTVKSFND